MYCNLNGRLLNEENASISINNRSFRYGDGFFETMKYSKGKLLLANYHFERLFQSLEKLGFIYPPFFTSEYITQQIDSLVIKNQHTTLARIRLTIFAGDGGLHDTESRHANCLIQSWPLAEAANQLNENGLVLGIYTGGFKAADSFANIKSNNYLLYGQAALFARQQHWNDALVLNHRGTIADATIANLFLIQGDKVSTPPLADGPVAGVMCRYLLDKLPALGFEVVERPLALADILAAEAVFLSNAMGIKWVRSVEDAEFTRFAVQKIYQTILAPLY